MYSSIRYAIYCESRGFHHRQFSFLFIWLIKINCTWFYRVSKSLYKFCTDFLQCYRVKNKSVQNLYRLESFFWSGIYLFSELNSPDSNKYQTFIFLLDYLIFASDFGWRTHIHTTWYKRYQEKGYLWTNNFVTYYQVRCIN